MIIGFVLATPFNSTLSIFLKPMGEELGWSRTAISGAVALGSLLAAAISFCIGPLLDRWGSRVAISAAVALMGLAVMGLSRCTALWHLYLFLGLARALANGVLDIGIVVTSSNWFIRWRGRVLGMAQLGIRVGQALFPLVAALLIASLDWRNAWVGVGGLAIFLAFLPSVIFLRRRPEDHNLTPDGLPPPSPTQGDVTATTATEPMWTARQAAGTSTFWLLTAAFSLFFLVAAAMNLHQYPYLTDIGIDPGVAVGALSTFFISAAVGALLLGSLADRFPVKVLLGTVQAGAALGIFMLILTRGPAMLYAYAVFYGICFGGSFPLFSLAFVRHYGRASAGSIRGLYWPLCMVFNAIGPVFAGWMFDRMGNYNLVFTIFCIMFLVGSTLVWLSRAPTSFPSPSPSPQN